jgi:Zn-finger nucleic acid-binding protein
MNPQIFHNIEIDSCSMCGGLWFDRHELAAYVKAKKIPFKFLSNYCLDDRRKVIREGDRKCPRCQKNMQVVTHVNVNVDYCPDCKGLWFDRGELSKILNHYCEEVGKLPKKPAVCQTERPVEEGWEEVVRITEDGIMEETLKPPEGYQKPVQEGTVITGDDPVAVELREGGTKEDIAKAMSGYIDQGNKKANASLNNAVGYSPGAVRGGVMAGTISSVDVPFEVGCVVADVAVSAADCVIDPLETGSVVIELAAGFAGFIFDLFD